MLFIYLFFFFFKQKTAYEMRISDWSSDVCSSDLHNPDRPWRIETGNQIGERRAAGRPLLDQARDGVRIPIEDDADMAAPHETTDDVSTHATEPEDRKSVVEGKGGSVRVDIGGRSIIKKKKKQKKNREKKKL